MRRKLRLTTKDDDEAFIKVREQSEKVYAVSRLRQRVQLVRLLRLVPLERYDLSTINNENHIQGYLLHGPTREKIVMNFFPLIIEY